MTARAAAIARAPQTSVAAKVALATRPAAVLTVAVARPTAPARQITAALTIAHAAQSPPAPPPAVRAPVAPVPAAARIQSRQLPPVDVAEAAGSREPASSLAGGASAPPAAHSGVESREERALDRGCRPWGARADPPGRAGRDYPSVHSPQPTALEAAPDSRRQTRLAVVFGIFADSPFPETRRTSQWRSYSMARH
jgi:hypothetical protein